MDTFVFYCSDIHVAFLLVYFSPGLWSGADWLPKFWWDFLSRGPQKMLPKKKMLTKKKKRSLNKNYKGAIAAAQTA
jgi:hypothetical protein